MGVRQRFTLLLHSSKLGGGGKNQELETFLKFDGLIDDFRTAE